MIYLLLRYLSRTPFGLTLQGLRDDPVRMGSLGYNVALHRTIAFAFAAFVAAVAGILFVWWNGHIDPASIDLGATIDVLVIAVIGGLYRLEGAWVGALFFVVVNNYSQQISFIGPRFHTLIGADLPRASCSSRPAASSGSGSARSPSFPGGAAARRDRSPTRRPGRAQRLKGGVDTARSPAEPLVADPPRFPQPDPSKEEGIRMNVLKRRWKLIPLAALAVSRAARRSPPRRPPAPAATPIKVAVLSDCQGAFGSFDNQDLAGVVTAMSQFAGAKPGTRTTRVRLDRRLDQRSSAQLVGHRLLERPCRHGHQGDEAPDGAAEADIMIGPLSGDESIAVANYAKQHPTKTFVDGSAGAQDTTLKVRAPNFFRFNGDGAQWNAGLGDLAYNKLGWRTAAVVAGRLHFAWTSAAGFIAEFCAVGGNVTKRVFPPLNTTDYSSYAQQIPTNVDGTFVAVGGAGLIPFLKAYEQAHGPINGEEVHRQPVLGHAGAVRAALDPRLGAYVGGAGTAGDLATRAAKSYNGSSASGSRRSRRSAQPRRRHRRRSRTATTSTPGA